jgi:CobQ-like glutamine amidotransferase family enzyme
VFDVKTYGTTERLIGNIVTSNEQFGSIVGYENHSGQTFLGEKATPLAQVIKGAGNNAKDGHEGVLYKNAIGTYLHGSILPKNPAIADFLIRTAVEKKYGELSHDLIDDSFAEQARTIAMSRPR